MSEPTNLDAYFKKFYVAPAWLMQLVRQKTISFEVAEFYQAIWRLSQRHTFCYASNAHLYEDLTGKRDEDAAKTYVTAKLRKLVEMDLVRVEPEGIRPNGTKGRLIYPLADQRGGVTRVITLGVTRSVTCGGNEGHYPKEIQELNKPLLEVLEETPPISTDDVLADKTPSTIYTPNEIVRETLQIQMNAQLGEVLRGKPELAKVFWKQLGVDVFKEYEIQKAQGNTRTHNAQAYMDGLAGRIGARIATSLLELDRAVEESKSAKVRRDRAEAGQLAGQARAAALREQGHQARLAAAKNGKSRNGAQSYDEFLEKLGVTPPDTSAIEVN